MDSPREQLQDVESNQTPTIPFAMHFRETLGPPCSDAITADTSAGTTGGVGTEDANMDYDE